MKSVQYVKEMTQTAQWASGKRQDLLEASEWYLGAQGHHLNREDQDDQEDPGESEEGRELVFL